MKNIKYLLIGALVALSLSSCDKDTEGLTYVTDHVNIQLLGDETVILSVGSEYEEPGYTGTLYDKNTGNYIDVTDKVIVQIINLDGEQVDEIDTSAMGVYYVTYSATSSDGFMFNVNRTVIICDPSVTLDIKGTYMTDMDLSLYGARHTPYSRYAAAYGFTGDCIINIKKLGPGFFSVDDLMGGFYEQIIGYGDPDNPGTYCMYGLVSVDNEGNIQLVSSKVPAWGYSLDYFDDAKYDLETGTISYSTRFAETILMDVVLLKQ